MSTKSVAQRAAWRWALSASTAFGRLGARHRVLPNFLIIGGQRCGTTSVASSLKEHPNIMFPRLAKGAHYFDTAYDRSPLWYRSHFPTSRARGELAARLGESVGVGEASPYYLFHPAVPGRIAATIPDVRVIAILRDPVKRAWSQYHHECTKGFENLDFGKAIACEEDRLSGAAAHLMTDPSAESLDHQHHSYVARGRYAEQLTRYFDALGRDRVHVLFSEELFTEPTKSMDDIQRFLEIPNIELNLKRENPSDSERISDSAEADLRTRFTDSDAALMQLLGRSLPWPTAATR
ncbi:MAG: sulfotransferase [Acidimicrobiia bacterium]|nr:sulfotransferase [Acidimicrobiia bacterium]